MSTEQNRVPIPGSERQALPDARVVGPVDPNERIEITITVRPRPSAAATAAADQLGTRWPRDRQNLSRDEFDATFGADPADLAKIEDFARGYNLEILESSVPRRSIRLSGTVAAFSTAFGVQLQLYERDGETYRGRVGSIQVPPDLLPIIQGVLGLDDRPQANPHLRVRPTIPQAASTSFSPIQIAELYNFPKNLTGQGQCVAIIELGGGYNPTELDIYFQQLGLTAPKVSAISVDGAANTPGTDTNADGEVLLDIEVVGAVAPGATIVVYFAPNTDNGFLDAITNAIHDKQNKPSVISISWGGPESTWTAQSLQSYNQAFQDAATLGVTICCASGDNGSSDGVKDGLAHVDFPASSPYVLACGGTSIQSSGNTITQETVWNDGSGATGGGISDVFPLPVWQSAAKIPPSANANKHIGRGLPDVAGDADPATGYSVLVDGKPLIIGGTSAVAPLWAGLIALINQRLSQPVGYLNPLLYNQVAGAAALHDITTGGNGAYQAGSGWDACTGFGSPDGTKLLQILSQGSPQPSPVPANPGPSSSSFLGAIVKWIQSLIVALKSLFSRDM